jgi:RNA 2',3'-cyclic 3'-phosphodiesterase
MKRLFVALDLAIPVVERLALFQEELAGLLADHEDVRVRWTSPENLHLTMKFLGDTDEALVPMLRQTLQELVKPLFPFEVEARDVGFFPRADKPRIIWSGFDEQSAEVLSLLQQALERDLEQLGFEKEDRPFRPHVTLGRVKSRARPDFTALTDKIGQRVFGKSYIKDVILYESELRGDGPRYTVLDRFALGV